MPAEKHNPLDTQLVAELVPDLGNPTQDVDADRKRLLGSLEAHYADEPSRNMKGGVAVPTETDMALAAVIIPDIGHPLMDVQADRKQLAQTLANHAISRNGRPPLPTPGRAPSGPSRE